MFSDFQPQQWLVLCVRRPQGASPSLWLDRGHPFVSNASIASFQAPPPRPLTPPCCTGCVAGTSC